MAIFLISTVVFILTYVIVVLYTMIQTRNGRIEFMRNEVAQMTDALEKRYQEYKDLLEANEETQKILQKSKTIISEKDALLKSITDKLTRENMRVTNEKDKVEKELERMAFDKEQFRLKSSIYKDLNRKQYLRIEELTDKLDSKEHNTMQSLMHQHDVIIDLRTRLMDAELECQRLKYADARNAGLYYKIADLTNEVITLRAENSKLNGNGL